MRRILVLFAALIGGCVLTGPASAAASSSVAALQVALRAQGHYPAVVDGVDGPLTHAGLTRFQQTKGIRATGKVGRATRTALGPLGRPLLGQRELGVGAVGWDVSSLEFRLIPFGLDPAAVDGPVNAATATALVRVQIARGLTASACSPAGRRGRPGRSRRRYRCTSSPPARASSRSPSATT